MQEAFVLVINSGSSSVKFALYLINPSSTAPLNSPQLNKEGIAEFVDNQTKITFKANNTKQTQFLLLEKGLADFHRISLEYIINNLQQEFDLSKKLIGIGHRVVHGGSLFSASTRISQQILEQIRTCSDLAPLHNPANISGIETLQALFPATPQVAVFDTAFHQTMPEYAYTYALPKTWTEDLHIRRYGFHGTSHRYITQQAARFFKKAESEISIINAHLGNGASVAAIHKGKSMDTSMGLTPLEGLVMGTRSGDIDPGLFDYLVTKGLSPKEINQALNKQSGLLGLSGLSNDMRTLCEASEKGHKDAALALDVFCFRAAKYIAAMMVSLRSLDALVFTGGIGENAGQVRSKIVEHLDILGFQIDAQLNQLRPNDEQIALTINKANSHPILVIPTDEEVMIVQDTLALISL